METYTLLMNWLMAKDIRDVALIVLAFAGGMLTMFVWILITEEDSGPPYNRHNPRPF